MVRQFRRIQGIVLILLIIFVSNSGLGITDKKENNKENIINPTSNNHTPNVNIDNFVDLEPNLSLNHNLDNNSGFMKNNLELTTISPDNPTIIEKNSINSNNLIKEEIPLTSQEQAKVYYEEGLKALDNNQEIEATILFKKSLNQDLKYHKSRIQLVKLYQKIGWSDENEKLLIEGLELAPEHSDFIKNLGLLYQQKGQMRKSLSVLISMPERETNQTDYLALLALAYLNTDQPELAINYYQQLLNINRENPLWYLGLAISLGATGKYYTAIDNFNKAKKLGRFNPETLDYINNKITMMNAAYE